jgi:hypothetical protein
VLVWSVLGGIGNGAYGMAFVTALQERTADRFQICVGALYETLGCVVPGVGFVVGGRSPPRCRRAPYTWSPGLARWRLWRGRRWRCAAPIGHVPDRRLARAPRADSIAPELGEA